jgi:hypothetical protein
VTVPHALTDEVRALFENDPGTAHLAVLPGGFRVAAVAPLAVQRAAWRRVPRIVPPADAVSHSSA